jgi:Flp pilus assembly protein TadG
MKRGRSEDGSILIEFALLLPPLVLMLAFMVDYALWIQKAMQIQDAAAAAAAYGAIPGKSSNTTQMTQLANYIATGSVNGASWFKVNSPATMSFYSCTPGGTHVTATTSCPTGAPYRYVQVTTTASPAGLLGDTFIPASIVIPSSMTLSGSATYRVEGTP